MWKYWDGRNRLKEGSLAKVDWESGATKAGSKSKLSWRHCVVKQSSGFCAMAKMIVHWKKQNNSACPQCGCPEEDTSHVLKCPAPGTWEVWKKSMAYLRVWLTMQKTSSEIRDAIFAGLVWYN